MEAHAQETGSRRAVELLDDWAGALEAFVEVAPPEDFEGADFLDSGRKRD